MKMTALILISASSAYWLVSLFITSGKLDEELALASQEGGQSIVYLDEDSGDTISPLLVPRKLYYDRLEAETPTGATETVVPQLPLPVAPPTEPAPRRHSRSTR